MCLSLITIDYNIFDKQTKMVFERKKGQPKGTFTTNYTNMDPDEQVQYHHEKV